MKRQQKICVIERDGRYSVGQGSQQHWVGDIRLASVYPEKQARRLVVIDIGMDCQIIEVEPRMIGTSPITEDIIERMARAAAEHDSGLDGFEDAERIKDTVWPAYIGPINAALKVLQETHVIVPKEPK